MPVSSTVIFTFSPKSSMSTVIVPPLGVNLDALLSKLIIHLSISFLSHLIIFSSVFVSIIRFIPVDSIASLTLSAISSTIYTIFSSSKFILYFPFSIFVVSIILLIKFNNLLTFLFITFIYSSIFSFEIPFSVLFRLLINCSTELITFNGVLSSWDKFIK